MAKYRPSATLALRAYGLNTFKAFAAYAAQLGFACVKRHKRIELWHATRDDADAGERHICCNLADAFYCLCCDVQWFAAH